MNHECPYSYRDDTFFTELRSAIPATLSPATRQCRIGSAPSVAAETQVLSVCSASLGPSVLTFMLSDRKAEERHQRAFQLLLGLGLIYQLR